jgi:hypothetical protein
MKREKQNPERSTQMPSSGDPDNLNAEDLAAVAKYESSEEGREDANPESPAERLTKLFYKTPEMQECSQTADAINTSLDPEDTVPVQIDVPRQFIRLTEFLEQKRATAASVAPVPAAKVLNQILLNELHDQLHWLITGPARFRYYRELWNRFCDQQGAPDQKIPAPQQPTEGEGGEGPF